MITVFNTVEALYEKESPKHSDEFNKGFTACFLLFKTGYEKTTFFSKTLEYNNLLAKHEKACADIKLLHQQIQALSGTVPVDLKMIKKSVRIKIWSIINSGKPDEEIVKELKEITGGWQND